MLFLHSRSGTASRGVCVDQSKATLIVEDSLCLERECDVDSNERSVLEESEETVAASNRPREVKSTRRKVCRTHVEELARAEWGLP